MSVVSKQVFYKAMTGHMDCRFVHPWESNCFKAQMMLTKAVLMGTAKFFFMIYSAQTALKWKKVNRNYFLQLAKSFLRSMVYGVVFVYLFVPTICIITRIFGELYYYVPFCGGVAGGASIFVESPENQALDVLIFFNTFVEGVIRKMEYYGVFKRTRMQQTLLFMTVSSVLMYLMDKQQSSFTNFWFYWHPKPKILDGGDKKGNTHRDPCMKFCLEGTKYYFVAGYAVNILKGILSKGSSLLNVKQFWNLLIRKGNFLFGLSIGGYVGLYRFITCFLLKTCQNRKPWHPALAGFLSGACHAFKPNLQITSIAITTALQMVVRNTFLVNIPAGKQLLLMGCNGFLIQLLVMFPYYCPTYYKNLVINCTNGLLQQTLDIVDLYATTVLKGIMK